MMEAITSYVVIIEARPRPGKAGGRRIPPYACICLMLHPVIAYVGDCICTYACV